MNIIYYIKNRLLGSVNQDLVSVAVEKVLLEMGKVEFNMVTSKLKNDFQIEIGDCLKQPIFLKQVLCELFGNSYEDIINSIEHVFDKLTIDEELSNFLTVLKD